MLGDPLLTNREQQLESRIKQLESALNSFQARFDPHVRGKGRGKKSSQNRPSTSIENIPSSSRPQRRQQSAPSIDSDLWTEDLDDEAETFFLKNVQLTLNGTLIDQVEISIQ